MSRYAVAWPQIVEALKQAGQPMSAEALAGVLGLRRNSVDRVIQRVRAAEPELLHIATWEKRRGPWCPAWALGNQPDALRPAPLTHAEHQALRWRRLHPQCRQRLRPLSAMRHIALAITQIPPRTPTELLAQLRAHATARCVAPNRTTGFNDAAAPAAQQQAGA